MKSNKEYKAISLSIDKDLRDKMDEAHINKSRLINDLIKKQIKKKKK